MTSRCQESLIGSAFEMKNEQLLPKHPERRGGQGENNELGDRLTHDRSGETQGDASSHQAVGEGAELQSRGQVFLLELGKNLFLLLVTVNVLFHYHHHHHHRYLTVEATQK